MTFVRQKGGVFQILPLLFFIFFINSETNVANAKKHIFHTKKDGRFLIAPIGEPFGFVDNGYFSISVYDFELSEKRSKTSKGGFFSSKKSHQGDGSSDDEYMRTVGVSEGEHAFEGGFVLKRFNTVSDFVQFESEIIADPSICIYDKFRRDRYRRRLQRDKDYDNYYYSDDTSVFDPQLGYADDAEFDDFLREGDDSYHYDLLNNMDVTEEGIYLSMKDSALWNIHEGDDKAPSTEHIFRYNEEGLYFLIYQVCASSSTALFSEVRSSFKVDLKFQNYDKFGRVSFLTAGEVHFPIIFFFFSISYCLLVYIWFRILRGESIVKAERTDGSSKVGVRAIHHLMTTVLILKALSMGFESVRYHFIALNGHAELWSFAYYFITFLKGVMLFTVILLIGSGWSLVKPFLQAREKKIIFFVLILQIIDNLALVVLLNEMEGEKQYQNWQAILHLVDIICCCAILLPIVWQVSSLENDIDESIESTRTLETLKLFRSFYLLVMAYIYFTRVIVYLVASSLSYKHTWVSTFLTELATVTFFVVVGISFRPKPENNFVELATDESIDREDAEYGEVELKSKQYDD